MENNDWSKTTQEMSQRWAGYLLNEFKSEHKMDYDFFCKMVDIWMELVQEKFMNKEETHLCALYRFEYV